MKRAQHLAIFLMVATGILGAQIVKSTILGTVRDNSGAVVANAKVSVRNVETNVTTSTVTDSTGNYVIALLNPGTYTAKVEQSGFKTAVQPNFTLDVAARQRVDFTLQVGEVSQEVEVTNATPLVQTDTATVGLTITPVQMTQLPVLGRNYQAFAQLSPTAVTPVANAVTTYVPGLSVGNYFQVAGQPGQYTSYTIDGIDANQLIFQYQGIIPSLDSIQEFKVQSHNFSAEYGRGSVQFTTTTKSGTNTLHGSAYEYVRNNILNANDFFAKRANRKKASFHYNQFGGSLGGPVVIPGLYNGKDKTFFFVAYEGTRYNQLGSGYATLPDPAWLKGDFSNLKNPDGTPRIIYDPATTQLVGSSYVRTAFPGNIIPAGRINPVAAAAIQFIPAPNAAAGTLPGTANYVNLSGTVSNVNYWAVRIDHHIGAKDSLYGRYMQSIEDLTNKSVLPISGTTQQNHGRNAMISETHIFNTKVVNEIRFGYNRALNYGLQNGANGSTDYVRSVFHLQNIGGGPLTYGLPSMSWAGYSSMGGSVDDPFAPLTNTYQITDNLITSFGHHSFKGGLDIRKERYNAFYGTFNRGGFSFTNNYTEYPGDTTNSGNPFADFLLGLPVSALGLSGQATGGFHQTMQNYFFQDDWRVTPKLTLNLGVRYEYYPPWTEERGRATTLKLGFTPGTCFGSNCAPASVVPSKPGQPYYNPDRNNWAPRLGFAYSPFENNKTTIRGAYGIFYSPTSVTDEVNSLLNPPTTLNFSIVPNNPFTDLTTTNLSNLFPTGSVTRDTPLVTNNWPLPPISLYTTVPNEPTAYIHQWQLSVQHEIIPNLLIEAGYIGSRGYNGQLRMDFNQATPPADPLNPTPLVSRLPYPSLSPLMFVIEHVAHNSYNAGTLRVERRFQNGLSFVGAYTFAKTLDDHGDLNDPTSFWPQNSYNLKAEWGLSTFNAKHRFTLGYVYDLPLGHGRRFGSDMNSVLNEVVGGWQVSGITTFQSGTPITLSTTQDFSNTGNVIVHRPNQVGPVHYMNPSPSNLQWFDPTAFANPALGTFGNAHRGAVIGPGINNWDITLGKYFSLVERAKLQFRAEMYNAFNHTQYSGVVGTIGVASAGRITSTRAPRNIQLALRLEF